MKINNDCIRDLILYLETKLTISYNGQKITYNGIHVNTIINNLESNHSQADIIYSLDMLIQCHYIVSKTDNLNKKDSGLIEITSITYEGQMFLETIRPQPIWNSTKKILKKVGVHSLKFIETVAHDIAVESSKEIIKTINPY